LASIDVNEEHRSEVIDAYDPSRRTVDLCNTISPPFLTMNEKKKNLELDYLLQRQEWTRTRTYRRHNRGVG
jgi:hypothetical protein